MMTLLNGKENTSLRFLAFDNIATDERKKLIDLGFVPGEELKILRDMKSGFITVLLKGGKIALDSNSASKILVKEV
ncbi:FeoA family protein [Candidatus Ruminimicrobiellum ovillum]|uniref:FeoA family protein n=1 Tax=Candidatus Ruminimicrobiellum ovillum TaxID=1947927 RepID=UPI001B2CB958|nr:ferrous iron transport protein A [Elusimicrobiota bacterium]MBQ1610088.1 ferrous iron transport protein A [Elusimicrobiota bacterium]MBQ4178514.1 ferrous iron transport protein A [Elusimicrobiota bacterium]MBR3654768.1 ferrous iron transport protein A [Elusimicrobiota bacterium]